MKNLNLKFIIFKLSHVTGNVIFMKKIVLDTRMQWSCLTS